MDPRPMTPLELAEHYFELSNQGKLDDIEPLFSENSTYSSDNQGLFLGRSQIMEMMRSFFAGYSSLNWSIEASRELKPGIAEIEFRFQGRDLDGRASDRRGVERIAVNQGGIQHIEVRKR